MKPIQNILLDLDGVLSDFLSLALERLEYERDDPAPGFTPASYSHVGNFDIAEVYGISATAFWHTIEKGDKFWCNLQPFPWAKEMVAWLKTIAPEWAMRHLGMKNSEMMIGGRKHLMARPGNVLIDDLPKNADAFTAAGGLGIVVPSNWNTHPIDFGKVKSAIEAALSAPNFGATGEFPDGKLHPDDEGELQFGIAHDQDNVRVDFGKPVQWLALPPDTAVQLAAILISHARQIRA